MNHADRERLSDILETIDDETNGYAPDEFLKLRIAEARAIVDHPVDPGEIPNTIINIKGIKIHDPEAIRSAVKTAFAQPPNPTLDAFLTEPIHEYTDRIPTRHRHRAINPWWLVVAFTIASILAVALTATPTTSPGPSHQPDPNSPTRANLAPTRDTHGYTYPPRTP